MKYMVELRKVLVVPGGKDEDEPIGLRCLKKQGVEFIFMPYPGLGYVYKTETNIFTEVISDVTWVDFDQMFVVEMVSAEASEDALEDVVDAHLEAGWEEVEPDQEFEDEGWTPTDIDKGLF